ncbi:MAG TPA: acylphosphatase [Nevskiaceae bacterium]|nr:acylphosphatase [Nevskiaceae bacterium]
MKKSYRFVVRGRVQGVGFRYATQVAARRFGLVGWVRNRQDGDVEGRVTGGDAIQLAAFRDFLEHGPPAAVVEDLSWNVALPTGNAPSNFAIRRD